MEDAGWMDPRADKPWAKFSMEFMNLPVRLIGSNINAGASIQITLGRTNTTYLANNCTGDVTATLWDTSITVRREYDLTVTSANLESMNLFFEFQPKWTAMTRRGRGSQPKTLFLLVDRFVSLDRLIQINNGSCTTYSNTWTIEITERLPANWRMEDGADDPLPAPGDGKWLEFGPGKDLNIKTVPFAWSVGLGRFKDGTAAGRLSLKENGLLPEIYTPTNIFFAASSEVVRDEIELIKKELNSKVLRQVRAYQTFVDIVPLTNATEMRFYFPSQVGAATNSFGHFTNFSGNPFVVWAVVNPEPATTNKLHIVERRSGGNLTNEFTYTAGTTNDTWVLKYGSGAEQRIEKRGVQLTTAGGVTNRIEVLDIRHAGDASPAQRSIETYRQFPWGFELVENRVDPDNNPGTPNDLITSFAFNTNSGVAYNYKKLDTVTYPDGYWEKRLYADNPDAPDSYGGLYWILTPDRSTVTNVSSATISNSIVRTINYDWEGRGQVREIIHSYNSEAFVNSFYDEWMYRETYDAGLGFDRSFDGFAQQEVTPLGLEDDIYFIGTLGMMPDPTWGFGTFGHTQFKFDAENSNEIAYTHGGTYNPTNQTFTVSLDEIWVEPDFRKCVIHSGYPEVLQDEVWDTDEIEVGETEGQPLFDSQLLAPFLYPNRSWREAFIYKAGSLVQKEFHIFTGMDGLSQPIFDKVGMWVYKNDSLGHATNITWIDAANGAATRIIYQADYKGTNLFDGELLLWEADEQGVVTTYSYDSQKRRTRTVKTGLAATANFPAQENITNLVVLDAIGHALTNTTSSLGLSLQSRTMYDVAGREISSTDTNGLTTTTAYDLGGRRTTITRPDASTEIRENYHDRRLKQVTGTGVVNEFHDWVFTRDRSTNLLMFTVAMFHNTVYGTNTSTRRKSEGLDWAGRTVRFQTPDFIATNSILEHHQFTYGSRMYTKRTRVIERSAGFEGDTPLFMKELYAPGLDGETNIVSLEVSEGGNIGGMETAAQLSRISRRDKYFKKIGGHWFQCITNTVYRADNSATKTFQGARHERLNGFSSASVASEVLSWNSDTNLVTLTTQIDPATRKLTEITLIPQSTLPATNITVNGLLQWESTTRVGAPAKHYYDNLGREIRVVDSLGFASTVNFNAAGQIVTGVDNTGLTTEYEYYGQGAAGAGKIKRLTVAGRSRYYDYTLRGELYRTWGETAYPEERVYNMYGDLAQLKTYRGGSGWNLATWPASPGTADTNFWSYQEHSGLLTNKTDAAGQSVNYAYVSGELKTRTWARNVTSTNHYNEFLELVSVNYSDGTPSLSYTNAAATNFNRLGLPRIVSDGTGVWRLDYDHAGRLTAAVCTNGSFLGITLSNRFNGLNGRDQLRVAGSSPGIVHDYRFDTLGRLGVVSNGVYSASYSYLPNSQLLRTTSFTNASAAKLVTTRAWDYGDRLRSVQNQAGAAAVTSHHYGYDAFNRRTRATLEDGSAWSYDYNDRNELVLGARAWPDESPVAGQQYEFRYDTIGNRSYASSGGDTNGANLRQTVYATNALNLYTTVTTPGYEDVVGMAWATNTVTVNSGATDRKGEFYHREITIGNASTPQWQSVTVTSGTTVSNGGFAFPKQAQSPSYDLDGNLTFDGIWTYQWDGENRLKSMAMTNITSVPNAHRKKLDFTYDYRGRRAAKTVSAWNGSSFASPVTTRYLYDEWNLVGELDGGGNLLRSYLWGSDISGTLTDAGGVQGLLLVADHVPVTDTYHFVAFDGNGNVTALVNAVDQSLSARYEYSPFGEMLRSTGPLASSNPFRWSTKFWDEESGLVYYGHRYYSPGLGRWLSRDPMGHEGGLNLLGFVGNNPINRFDPFGLYEEPDDDEWELDLRLAIAAEGSAFVATYAYSEDMLELHNAIMDEAMETLKEAGKEIAWTVGLSVGGGIAGGIIAKGFARVAQPVLTSLAGKAARSAIGATGKIGEKALKRLGGKSQKFFETSRGARFVDQFVNGIAHESKVGYTSLTKGIRRQIAKDVELMAKGDVNGVTWHFFKSPVTGKGGPSGPLRDALEKAGIKVIVELVP